MNPWIDKAVTSLRNDRPRLAALYMRRGLSESFEGRAWLVWFDTLGGAGGNHAADLIHSFTQRESRQ